MFEVRDIYGYDATELLPSDASGDGYRIRSDDNGFTVTLGGVDASPPTTYDYTWAEFGITPDQIPYLTGEIPASRTWSATWDGTPTMSETAVPTGPTLASPEGFVRWNDNTWHSPDGLTWTASPLPDPTGTVQNVFPVDDGFVAFVVSQDGATDVYRLDERGGEARRIDIDDVPESFSTGFAGQTSPGLQSPQTSAALLSVGPNGGEQAPLVIDLDGYRFVERGQNISLIDLATGDTLYTFSPFSGPPAADTWLTFDSDGFTVTDPVTEVELLQIPIETYRAAQDARREALGPIESGRRHPPRSPRRRVDPLRAVVVKQTPSFKSSHPWRRLARKNVVNDPTPCGQPVVGARVSAITEHRTGAEPAHPALRGTGECVRVSCGELAEPFGDRVDGRLAGGDVDHEIVDVVVAGA